MEEINRFNMDDYLRFIKERPGEIYHPNEIVIEKPDKDRFLSIAAVSKEITYRTADLYWQMKR